MGLFVFIIAAAVALGLCSTGCASGKSNAAASGEPSKADYAQVAEIEEALRDALMKKLADIGKIDPVTGEIRAVSAPPSGIENKPQLLAATTLPNADLRLRFIERLSGDYDLSGDVGVPDITPIALNYLAAVFYDSQGLPLTGEQNERLAVIDGDKSGEVGISDITPIALNYLRNLAGYNLYRDGELIAGLPGEPSLPRPKPGESGWRDGRWPIYEFLDFPGGDARTIEYTLKPVDRDGAEGEGFDFAVLYNPQIPLAAPAGLTATAGDASVFLDWNDNTEPNLAGYNVYVSTIEDVPPASPDNAAPVAVSEYIVADLENGTAYYFWVTAVSIDTPPQESPFSNGAEATPDAIFAPPAPPTGLAAVPGNESVSLSWNPNSEPDLAGYNVYRSTFPEDASPLLLTPEPITETSFGATGLTNDTEYFFWVGAVDTQSPPAESEKAGPVSATPSQAANLPPVAVAEGSPLSGLAPLNVTFTAGFSHDPDGSIALYRWDFENDGTWDFESAITGDTSHRYGEAGIFTAKLEVTDNLGATGGDTVTISVTGMQGDWTTTELHAELPVHDLALAHFKDGRAGIAVSEATGGARPLHFFTALDGDVTKETVSESGGGDAVEIDINYEAGVFIGHAQFNEMFEDSGYLNYTTGDGWVEESLGTIYDGTRVHVGASHEGKATAGYFPLGEDSYILVYDVAGERIKSPTGVFRPHVVNPVMKSDSTGGVWLKDESGLGYAAVLNGNTWTAKLEPEFDWPNLEYFFRAEFAENPGLFVIAGSEGSDSQGLVRYTWDGETYTYTNTRWQTWFGEKKGAAIGPDGELYFWVLNRPSADFIIRFYYDERNKFEELPLEGPIAGGAVGHAKMDVRLDGTPAIVYQMEGSSVLYYATFPRPPIDRM